ncbi:MAG TPA: tetratricopeptide repeat protein [Thermoanaerobaculia bacterium]|nr:tetratricopeptide repeat protein [Thermoanaerobaculia bacterium]
MTRIVRFLLALVVLVALCALPLAATCGGGGGGGMGGVRTSGGPAEGVDTLGRREALATYQVPWAVVHNGEEVPAPLAAPAGAPADNLVVYWFPRTQQEAKSSDLQASRELTLLTARCVTLALVASDNAELRSRFRGGNGPYVVLAEAGGKELGRVAADSGPHLKAAQVEKLVSAELRGREAALDRQLAAARDKEGHGDVGGAVALYQQVWTARCLVPGKIPKKAAEALKKLGHPVPPDTVGWMSSRPAPGASGAPGDRGDRSDRGDRADRSQRVVRTMAAGLAAEDAGRYLAARTLYARAHRFDPADPVPLRYLGELYRHHTGDWAAARRTFEQILDMPADPISRAVALHGLGKMTIHAGDFARGLALIEQSVATYPLPLAYRNLAVYWNSEGQVEKAQHLAEQALALDPDDPYTQIFVAAFIAEDGRREEALRIAHAHEDLLAASYNLAAIHSLLGHRREALALLRRHFYDYERFDAVRAKEMKEAREDIVFTALKDDPEFIALTAKAETPEQAAQPQGMPGGRAMPGAKAMP